MSQQIWKAFPAQCQGLKSLTAVAGAMLSLEAAIKASPLNKEHLTKMHIAMDELKGSPIFADVHLAPPLTIAASAPQSLFSRGSA